MFRFIYAEREKSLTAFASPGSARFERLGAWVDPLFYASS
jgi:hypothetical protein